MSKIKTKERLGKNLNFFSVFAIGTGTMIGAGIFVLPSIAISSAGPAAVLSFILGGLIALATTLSVVELATGMPRAGGSYYFISRAMGPLFGTIIGVGAWLSLVFKGSFALIGLAEYLKVFIPMPILITATAVGLLLLIINCFGAKSSGQLQNGIVVGLIVILATFIFRGSSMVEMKNFKPFMPYGVNSVFITTGIIFISYLGIAKLAAISEEVKNPDKNIPRAFIGSVITVIILYAGIILVINGIMPLEKLVNTNTPLVHAADMMADSFGRIVITIAGFLATVSTANASLLSSSRFPFAMARDNLMPQSFVELHDKYQTPYRSIIITGLTIILLLLLFNVEQLAKLGSTFNVLVFVLVNIAAIILRQKSQKWYKPSFRDPFYPFSQIFGILGCLLLLPQLGLMSLIFTVAVIIVSIVWYRMYGIDNALPEYNVFDILEDNEIPTTVADQNKKVLVPLANPDHESDLLSLSTCLADSVVGLNVVEVPDQTSLQAAQQAYQLQQAEDYALQQQFIKNLNENEVGKYLIAFNHDTAEAIIDQSSQEKVDLVIMGWQEKQIKNITNKIFSRIKSNVAALKGKFSKDIQEITVAYNDDDNSRYGLYLAKRLAHNTGAKIKVLQVINPDLDSSVKEKIKDELIKVTDNEEEYSMEYVIKERYSVIDTIIERTKQTDLTIIGNSNRRFTWPPLRGTSRYVARHNENPILIVQKYKPFSQQGLKSNLDRLTRKLKGRIKSEKTTTTESQIEVVFPSSHK